MYDLENNVTYFFFLLWEKSPTSYCAILDLLDSNMRLSKLEKFGIKVLNIPIQSEP